jgi:PHD/YefM family antitoxin component YafN of YafNO toxin-antitoxin module
MGTELQPLGVNVMVNIRPSATIRKNYKEISDLCKKTGEPVYLTKNGSGDLVVMDVDSFSRRESMLKLRETLLRAEENRIAGKPGHTIDETAAMMRTAIREVADGKRG